jgi:hypothetical protein
MQRPELSKEVLGRNRFFALGSQPTGFQNDTEYDIAVTNVWPILFVWDHQQGSSGQHDTIADLRCLRANQVMSGSRTPSSVPSRGDAVEQKNNPSGGSGGNGGSSGPSGPQGSGAVSSATIFSGGLVLALAASVAALF